jgi:hypothetical protein
MTQLMPSLRGRESFPEIEKIDYATSTRIGLRNFHDLGCPDYLIWLLGNASCEWLQPEK